METFPSLEVETRSEALGVDRVTVPSVVRTEASTVQEPIPTGVMTRVWEG
jgi:hypothetical protein